MTRARRVGLAVSLVTMSLLLAGTSAEAAALDFENASLTLGEAPPCGLAVLRYTSTLENAQGVALRIHWDSTRVSSYSPWLFLPDFVGGGGETLDVLDHDGDPRTDVFETLVWADVEGDTWPPPPFSWLATRSFCRQASFSATTVNLSLVDAAAGETNSRQSLLIQGDLVFADGFETGDTTAW